MIRRNISNGKKRWISGRYAGQHEQSDEAGTENAEADGNTAGRAGSKGIQCGGGVVEVTVTGKREVTKVKIDPEAVDPDDVEMLEDLIMAATNEALRKCEEESQAQMSKITGGLSGLTGGLF